jgi:hypothetical protein
MRITCVLTVALILLPAARAVELTDETRTAFDQYISNFEAHRFKNTPFIRVDDSPHLQQEVKNGQVAIVPGPSNGENQVKGGLIHDWIGDVFFPGVTLDRVLSAIQDYNRQKTIYPDIQDSRIKGHNGDDFTVYLRIMKSKMMMTDVLNTDHTIHFTRVDSNRAYCSSHSTRIAEVSDAGTSREHELPVGKDRGILWRMNGYWFFEERDGGVYAEFESITLSRDIPAIMSKILGPVLHGVPVESLRSSLERTKQAMAVKETTGVVKAGL